MHGEEKEEGEWKENDVTHQVIGAAIDVHRVLGPGLLEVIYDEAMCHELALRNIPFLRQQRVPLVYKGVRLHAELRYDILVAGKVLIEVKARENFAVTDKAQLLSYLRLLNLRVGLLINFHSIVLKDGLRRVVNGPVEALPPLDPPSF